MTRPSGGGGSCLQRVNLYVSEEAAKTLEKKTCVMQKGSFIKDNEKLNYTVSLSFRSSSLIGGFGYSTDV